MPWLSRQNSAGEGVGSVNDPPKIPLEQPVHAVVNFIPAQIDGLCGTSPGHHKQASTQLLFDNLLILMQNINCLPAMIRSISSQKVLRGYFSNPADAGETLLQFCLALAQAWMMAVALPAFLVFPGSLFTLCLSVCWFVTAAMTWPLRGQRIVMNHREQAPMTDNFRDERWIYVNGMACSNRSLRIQCSRLSHIFGRPIAGVHNRTSGLVLDFITFLLQRCLSFSTPCTLTLTSQLHDACLTNSVRKVVLISHSTGAVHVSLALDRLHASLPVGVLSKLEIYTFGSGASHLSNPCLRIDSAQNTGFGAGAGNIQYTRPNGSIASPVKATLASLGHYAEDHERVIPHIEHYALASDIFARCGVIHYTRNVLDNCFCGRVFILDDAVMSRAKGNATQASGGGFLMNEHYLDLLFPVDAHHAGDVLDLVVEVEVETAEKREFTAQGMALSQKSLHPGNHSPRHSGESLSKSYPDSPDVSPKSRNGPSSDKGEKGAGWETAAGIGIDSVRKARVGAKDCGGKTVKQLSRLWRYAQGGRPVGEGVAVINGMGKGMNGNGTGKEMKENGVGIMQ